MSADDDRSTISQTCNAQSFPDFPTVLRGPSLRWFAIQEWHTRDFSNAFSRRHSAMNDEIFPERSNG